MKPTLRSPLSVSNLVSCLLFIVFLVFISRPLYGQEWATTYGGANFDSAISIQQASFGYIVAGYTASFGAGGADFWVLRLDTDGDVLLQKTYGGMNADVAFSIQQTADGGYIVAVFTASFGAGEFDFWVLKLGIAGSIDPSCDFIGKTDVSGVDSSATVEDTDADVDSTSVTGEDSTAVPKKTNVSGDIICQGFSNETPFAKGLSSIKFNNKKPSRDTALMRMCVDEDFCDALEAGPQNINLAMDGCAGSANVPGNRLKSNKDKTIFKARSKAKETPGYSLLVDCKKHILVFKLTKADLKTCSATNPIFAFVGMTAGPSIHATETFDEKLRGGNLTQLRLKSDNACSP